MADGYDEQMGVVELEDACSPDSYPVVDGDEWAGEDDVPYDGGDAAEEWDEAPPESPAPQIWTSFGPPPGPPPPVHISPPPGPPPAAPPPPKAPPLGHLPAFLLDVVKQRAPPRPGRTCPPPRVPVATPAKVPPPPATPPDEGELQAMENDGIAAQLPPTSDTLPPDAPIPVAPAIDADIEIGPPPDTPPPNGPPGSEDEPGAASAPVQGPLAPAGGLPDPKLDLASVGKINQPLETDAPVALMLYPPGVNPPAIAPIATGTAVCLTPTRAARTKTDLYRESEWHRRDREEKLSYLCWEGWEVRITRRANVEEPGFDYSDQLIIMGVDEWSPAGEANLRFALGWTITRVNGQLVKSEQDMPGPRNQKWPEFCSVGSMMRLTVAPRTRDAIVVADPLHKVKKSPLVWEEYPPAPREGMRPGDWICPGCELANHPWTLICRQCNTDRPPLAGTDLEWVALSARVKLGQTTSLEWKMKWEVWVDATFNGQKDPRRFTTEELKAAIEVLGEPPSEPTMPTGGMFGGMFVPGMPGGMMFPPPPPMRKLAPGETAPPIQLPPSGPDGRPIAPPGAPEPPLKSAEEILAENQKRWEEEQRMRERAEEQKAEKARRAEERRLERERYHEQQERLYSRRERDRAPRRPRRDRSKDRLSLVEVKRGEEKSDDEDRPTRRSPKRADRRREEEEDDDDGWEERTPKKARIDGDEKKKEKEKKKKEKKDDDQEKKKKKEKKEDGDKKKKKEKKKERSRDRG
eukprot:TRINITY_DN7067_c2_g1_i1.p1 TRINITY_DN7067_c2_g1~~TRINITY_DN7067_c2_g1_i1.p1  ORF type:complete len:768 (+),score=199.67 TRINITY_DN7067_c2_g1_i1:63-2306(+)